MIKKMVLAMTILSAASAACAEDFGLQVYDTATDVKPVVPGMFPQMTSFQGATSDVTIDPTNYCFDGTPQSTFAWGSIIATNAVWQDTAEATTMFYNVTLGVQLQGVLIILNEWTAEYTGLTPGSTYTFCAAEFTSTPPGGPSGLGVPWGKRVVQAIGSPDSVQGQLGTIVLQ